MEKHHHYLTDHRPISAQSHRPGPLMRHDPELSFSRPGPLPQAFRIFPPFPGGGLPQNPGGLARKSPRAYKQYKQRDDKTLLPKGSHYICNSSFSWSSFRDTTLNPFIVRNG